MSEKFSSWTKKPNKQSHRFVIFRRNIDSQSVYAVLSKSLVSLGIDNTRGNPGNSGQFWALRFSTDLSKILFTACVKYYLLSILNTILFCFKSQLFNVKLIFPYFMKKIYSDVLGSRIEMFLVLTLTKKNYSKA